jgi:hypothetical protein
VGSLTRRVVALERSVAPFLAQRSIAARIAAPETLTSDEVDRRISVLENAARLWVSVHPHGTSLTPEIERAIIAAEGEIDWPIGVPADRYAGLSDDEIDAEYRRVLVELEATTWPAA